MDNFRMIVYFISQIVVLNTVTASKNSPGIGQGFFIPNVDLFGDFLDGTSIFKNVPPNCCPVYLKKETKRVQNYFKTTEVFYRYISNTFGVSTCLIGEFTLGTTLSQSSAYISGSSLQTSGFSLNFYSYKDTTILSKDCQISQPLSEQFLVDFKDLPPNQLAIPKIKSNWHKYDRFLRKYGSHVVKEIQHGSRIQVFIFSEESKHYSEKQFLTRACLFAVANGLMMDVCAGYSEKEVNQVSSLTMSQVIRIKGGTLKTRSKLLTNRSNRTKALIEKFLIEGDTSPGNISYKFVPIWDILKQHKIGSNNNGDNYARALNLEAYYKVVLDFGCTLVTKNGIDLRWMEAVGTLKRPEYRCFIQSLGCRDDDSCDNDGFSCYCQGEKCVDTRKVSDRNSKIKTERFIRRSKKGGTYDGINKSCKWKSPTKCECDTDWGGKPVEIWPTDCSSEATFIRVSMIIYIPTLVSLIMMIN